MKNVSDDTLVISTYTVEQAIADGVLAKIFENRWRQLSGGKPIVVTAHLVSEVSQAALVDIWNEFVDWKIHTEKTLPEEKRLFVTTVNEREVWLTEDDQAFTMLYPEDD